MNAIHRPVLIIGSGPAGYTAAIYAARAMLKPLLVTGLEQGGQLTITTDVENYPGFPDPVTGPWLVDQMRLQAEHVGTEIVNDLIVDVDFEADRFRAKGDSGQVYTSDALIIATGAKAKWLGIPSEQKFMGFGVSACATCDGFFYRNRKVIVVGGGNTAIEEALYLSHLAAEVTLVHRRDSLRGEKILQERLAAKSNVRIVWDSVIDEIYGDEGTPPGVTGAVIRNIKSGETSRLAADGIFVAIGHAPQAQLFKDKLKTTPSGYIWTVPGSTVTSVPGVFAAGDVADEVYRQAVTAAGLGCMAALEAEKFLASRAVEPARQLEAVS